MLLKYKEDHKPERSRDKTHNPKVGGSNPPPATNSSRIFHNKFKRRLLAALRIRRARLNWPGCPKGCPPRVGRLNHDEAVPPFFLLHRGCPVRPRLNGGRTPIRCGVLRSPRRRAPGC